MCGIAGIFAYDFYAPRVAQDELIRIRRAMISRGPDGEGLWIADKSEVGLAHRRLSIIDLSDTGRQPMSIEDGHYRIVFNGEIYNYQTLRRELEDAGWYFHSTSDTEVLPHLYETRGKEMVQALRDADWAGMAHSLEIRTPLVDWELFKALVPHLIQEGSRPSKKEFAATPAKPLPKTVTARPKSGFSVPVHEWLDEYAGERGLRGWARFIAKEFDFG